MLLLDIDVFVLKVWIYFANNGKTLVSSCVNTLSGYQPTFHRIGFYERIRKILWWTYNFLGAKIVDDK